MFEEMFQSDFTLRELTWNWHFGGLNGILGNKELYCTKIEIYLKSRRYWMLGLRNVDFNVDIQILCFILLSWVLKIILLSKLLINEWHLCWIYHLAKPEIYKWKDSRFYFVWWGGVRDIHFLETLNNTNYNTPISVHVRIELEMLRSSQALSKTTNL